MSNSLSSRIGRFAPVATAALLIALAAMGGIDPPHYEGVDTYMATVRTTIEAVPHRIGGSVGSDVEPTEAAIRLLAPNKILQRRYIDPLDGSSLSLLIVHCGDVRDMLGHYPPVCYPAHGWQPATDRSVRVEIAGTTFVARVYEYSRRDDLLERRMTVLNFFVLPRGGAGGEDFASDMHAVERIARRKAAAALGVAQVQIVMDGTPGNDEQMRIAGEVLPVLEPIVRAIGRGVER